MRIAISTEMDYMSNPQSQRSICNSDYIEFVLAGGYSPYVVCVGMDVEAIAEDMDGLLLSGGKDLNPTLWGGDLEWNGAKKCNIVRDCFERELYDAFIKNGKPVFGICRGFQLIVILSSGDKFSLEQDINKLKDIKLMHQQGDIEITGDNPVHTIECRGVMKELIGDNLAVNSFHHQGFMMMNNTHDAAWIRQSEQILWWARSREPAFLLEAFGRKVCSLNGVVTIVGGVQYHPERMLRRDVDREKHLALFKYTMNNVVTDYYTTDAPNIENYYEGKKLKSIQG